MAIRDVLDASVGCSPFTLRLLRSVHGRSFELQTGATEELLFVLVGAGEVIVGDDHAAVEPETGVLLRAGSRYELHNDSADTDLVVVAVALHDPEAAPGSAAATAV